MTVSQLKNNIQNNRIEHLYLFTGPEIGEKKEIIDLIEQKVFGNEEKVTKNVYIASDLDPSEIVDAIESNMLFSSKKIIYLKNIELLNSRLQKTLESIIIPTKISVSKIEYLKNSKFKNIDIDNILKCYILDETTSTYVYNVKIKDTDRKKLISALANTRMQSIDDDTYIIMINETNEKIPTGVTSLIGAEQQIVFWEMFDNQKTKWIRDEFQKRGLYIEDVAIEFIIDTVENNKYVFLAEIERICTYYQKASHENKIQNEKNVITRDLIESYLYHSKDETAFSLYSALILQNVEKALYILDKIFYTDEDSIVSGLMWSHKRFLKLLNLVHNEKMQLDVAFGQMYIKMKKVQEEFAIAIKKYSFYEASMLTYQLVELEYYSRMLPSELKRIKYQEFIINFVNKKNLDKFWLGENILLLD